jgi:protein gp37
MSGNSKIEWTNSTWNPIRALDLKTSKIGWHCEHATTGCENCYSEGFNKRLGTGLPFKPGHRAHVKIFLDEKMLLAPLHWRKPRMIFVCSMTDLFASFVLDEFIDRVFDVMDRCPQHTFQLLTKRAERMRDYLTARGHAARNVWLGVSAERQQEFNERWPYLRETPAAVRFISYEPALGRLDACEALGIYQRQRATGDFAWERFDTGWPRPDWFICGGESGRGARPMCPDWARSLRDQCVAADIQYFFKQWGQWAPLLHDRALIGGGVVAHRWADGSCSIRVGKKLAGRLLDGVEHNGFPGTAS